MRVGGVWAAYTAITLLSSITSSQNPFGGALPSLNQTTATPAPSDSTEIKCMSASYTYPDSSNRTCRGWQFNIRRCVRTQAEANAFAASLEIPGEVSDEDCALFYDNICTNTIIGGATPKRDASCNLYCDRNFDKRVTDCDVDADCLPGAPVFSPSPCCQAYELVCDNVDNNILQAWIVNSACVWRRCMGFDAAPRTFAPNLGALLLTSLAVFLLSERALR